MRWTLLQQITKPVKSFRGDDAYDKDKIRKLLAEKAIKQVIPPQHNAIPDLKNRTHRVQRDEAIKEIAAMGRKEWKVKEDYHQRSKSETTMFRYNTIIEGTLAARKPANQKTEVAVGCKIFNSMLRTTKPQSRKRA